MARELRGQRYLDRLKPAERQYCIDTLARLRISDYEETCGVYQIFVGGVPKPGIAKPDPKNPDHYFVQPANNDQAAWLGCNDRYFLLTVLCNRVDALHAWLFDRCREVENEPDGFIDLWSRFHYKSTIITYAGAIQEVLCDPEIKIAMFSVVKPIAAAFLSQVKEEFENNEVLKDLYADVLYINPRGRGPDGRPAKWGLARGITVKRKSRPKEATIEAHGLIDGQPTSRHYDLHIYDDVVTQDHLSEEAIRKTTARWEMADNLGSHLGCRKWMPGTRYHYADTYSVVMERKSLKPRIYPATDNGKLDGTPVFLSEKRWEEIKRDQRSTVSAQCLLNPIAGTEATFQASWLRTYEVLPAVMNVYIMVDPALRQSSHSDRTAIAVIGIDPAGNKYLIDGMRHRCKLTERWNFVKNARRKWMAYVGNSGTVKVGWERYGKDVEMEVIKENQQRENELFEIVELNSAGEARGSKDHRIARLEPDIRGGKFFLPITVHYPDLAETNTHNGDCYWSVWTEEKAKEAEAKGEGSNNLVGQIIYRRKRGLTKAMQHAVDTAQGRRVMEPLKRYDENKDVYDVTRAFIEEMVRHPFANHDDLIDAVSRIYDIGALPPDVFEKQSTDPIGLESIPGTASE